MARTAADLALGYAITGLAVSIAGNIGHIQASPGHPVITADRLTAATSPLAAFAGLAIGLLVLKMTRHHPAAPAATAPSRSALAAEPTPANAQACTPPDHAAAGLIPGQAT